MGTVSRSVTLVPSGYTGNTGVTLSTNASYQVSNGYKGSGDTSSTARIQMGTSTTGYLYYTFDTSEIPSGATITSITGTVTVRVSSTSRVTDTKCQLFTGTTAKGSNVTFASTTTSNTVTLSPGSSWTRSELNDFRLKIGGTGSSSSQTKYIYFAGASVTVNYSITTYDVTVTNSTSATVTVDNESPAGGDDVTVFADTVSGIVIKDNGADVTSQFATVPDGSISAVPGSTVTTGFSASGAAFYQSSSTSSDSWLRYAIGHSAESPYSTSNTSNTYVKPEGDTGWMNYPFDFSDIPVGATIKTVGVKVYGARENATVDSTHVARFQCYSGSTAKGTLQNFTSTSNSLVTVTDVGTWTRAELQDAQLRFEVGYYGGRMLGITWTVEYEVDGYVYTITNIQADHAIVVTQSGGDTTALYVKLNGTWTQVQRAYLKSSGSWTQVAVDQVFQSGTNYVKGN